jgi:AcrR family transcriptional regulator
VARRAMLDVAIDLLGRKGYAGMTLASVGRLSGYSHGLATMYFGSKAELAKEVAVETDRRYFEFLHTSSAGATSGLEFVHEWVTANFKFVDKYPHTCRAGIVVLVEAFTTVHDVRAVYDGLADRNAMMLCEALVRGINDGSVRSDVDAGPTSLTISAAIAGVNYQWLGNSKLDLESRRIALLQTIDAVCSRGTSKESLSTASPSQASSLRQLREPASLSTSIRGRRKA